MELHNNNTKISLLREIRNRLGAKTVFIILFVVLVLGGFGLGCIIYGGYLNKTRQNIQIGKVGRI